MLSYDVNKQSGFSNPEIRTKKPQSVDINYGQSNIDYGRIKSNGFGTQPTEIHKGDYWYGTTNDLAGPKEPLKKYSEKKPKVITTEQINDTRYKYAFGAQSKMARGLAYDQTSLGLAGPNPYNRDIDNGKKAGAYINNAYAGYIENEQFYATYTTHGAGVHK